MKLLKYIRIVLFSIAASLAATFAYAQTESTGLGAGYAIKTFVSLLVVLFLIVALVWLLKRMQGITASSSAAMQILASLPVGPREKLMLVQVGNEQLLIGVTSSNVQFIKAMDEPVDLTSTGAKGAASPVFSSQLQKLLKQQN